MPTHSPASARFFGLPIRQHWQPWPSAIPPELHCAAGFEHFVALLGADTPRGRYGLFGVPGGIETLAPGPGAIAAAADDRLEQSLRVLLLGYEMGAPEAHLQAAAPPRGQLPGLAADFATVLAVDHVERRWTVAGYDELGARRLSGRMATPRSRVAKPSAAQLVATISDEAHGHRIEQTVEHIRAGEIYQANIARHLEVSGSFDPLAVAPALYKHNHVAHGALVNVPGVRLLSNSMETLVTFDPAHRVARSYPIKGTRARAGSRAAEHLRGDPKEQAEHVMIVDLVRNDLGKVCELGSVEVPELMGVQGYRGVVHGVSTVSGRLAADRTPGQLLAALFPGGSITGAPKRRAMQIIREVEAQPRGFYTGTLAIIGADGSMSASILIRTAVEDARGWSLAVGGGIVADSTPAREIAETWEKVQVFVDVLGGAAQAKLSTGSNTANDVRSTSSTAGSTTS